MRVLGLITEYNPFHNGHLFHLQMAKKISGAEYTIAVMSGNFLQRGEPAMFNKWSRAAMAVGSGIDLVLELPFAYASRSAAYFAQGAVDILDKTGIVTDLCFGSESGDIEQLQLLAQLLADETDEMKTYIKDELALGVTLPLAKTKAMVKYSLVHGIFNQTQIKELSSQPNNVLGLEYLTALQANKSNIKPFTIKRLSAAYHDENFHGQLASASGIRAYIKKNGWIGNNLADVVPKNTLGIINEEVTNNRLPIFIDNLTTSLLTRLRTIKKEELAAIFDVNEGLENKIIAAAKDSTSYNELIANIKSKRYTRTRIQRILIHTLLNFDKKSAHNIDSHGGVQYLRVLAFSEKGQQILRLIKKQGQLPLITKVTSGETLNEISRQLISFDIMATDLYTALYPNQQARKGRLDYLQGPIIKK